MIPAPSSRSLFRIRLGGLNTSIANSFPMMLTSTWVTQLRLRVFIMNLRVRLGLDRTAYQRYFNQPGNHLDLVNNPRMSMSQPILTLTPNWKLY